jgi:L,D-peptidoglycan transpeptidase YkuD (ErfK/YbiS/YcfS/YnhG family)
MIRYRVAAAALLLPALVCGGSSLPLGALAAPVPVVAASLSAVEADPAVPHAPVTLPSPTAPAAVPRAPRPVPTARTTATAHQPVVPRPVAKPVPAFAFPVPVAVGNATEVITVRARGSYATVTAWQHGSNGWRAVLSTTSARVGANGVVAAAVRRQGTDTTPGGTFALTQAFGIAANPGAHLPYHRVTNDDWWVEDNNSAYYNQLRPASLGGFNTALPESDVNGSEHLITHSGAYQYAVVIDYNRWPAVHYKGAGIFLHVNGAGATAGCVSVPSSTMVALLRWLDPAQHPRIAIA